MKTKIVKTICTVMALMLMCLMAVSCGTKSEPAYVLEASVNNGLVESYKAYFELNGKTVSEVREVRFKNLVNGSSSNYKEIEKTTYTYTAVATTSNASDWRYTQERAAYDTAKLIKYLKKMEVRYTGNVEITISEFDDYVLIEVRLYDGHTPIDVSTGLFKNDKLVKLPNGISLQSLAKVYKHK
ncbi:hypothetical protein [Butyrivibrio sp. AE2032]|uniref:hypothetical protein n=1 Tax=Butyrivibrio sp. AE2032 TaxID=1458463 RepID=UPI00054F8841|nr:hypothetical protein [Butyrivibrio sp. AE2032]